jgi:hypothetical protein
MKTFKVDNVKMGSLNAQYLESDNKRTITGLVGTGVEASSVTEGNYLSSTHNLLASINTAYDQHLPLTLSPDMLWLLIAQGLSTHITNNAEQLRSRFVNFEGKKELIVYEDDFRKCSPNNDWPHMFGEFSTQLAEYIGKKRDLIVNSFSTTGAVERAASEIVLMEAMSKYFDYTCVTRCGIPEITLLGSISDWQDILVRVRNIAEFDLSWWTAKLEPIAQEFVNAAQGNPNVTFWRNIYKKDGRSGGPFITGWITHLFPYLKNGSDFTERNDFSNNGYSYTTDTFPLGMAKVPFKWKYFQEEFKMELAAGFSGFQIKDGSLTPQVGWFVRDTELMVDLKASFKSPKDWQMNNQLRQGFMDQLTALGFEENGSGWGHTISGHLPKTQVAAAKQIVGLTFVDRDNDE